MVLHYSARWLTDISAHKRLALLDALNLAAYALVPSQPEIKTPVVMRVTTTALGVTLPLTYPLGFISSQDPSEWLNLLLDVSVC